MDKSEKRIKRLFPKYFNRFELPEGAKEEKIEVYRACISHKCNKESFTPSFEENGMEYLLSDEPSDPGLYSLSTFEKPKDVKRFVKVRAGFPKPYKIAIGYTDKSCGLVQRTKERTGRKTSHVDWWLYIDAKPYLYFKIIEDFKEYMEEYKKKVI